MKDPKVLFPHTSARSWEEHRGEFKAVRLEVRIFDLVLNGMETAPTKELEKQPIIHDFMIERLYNKMNHELSHYELQCLPEVILPIPTDKEVWLSVLAWDDFTDSFVGIVLCAYPYGRFPDRTLSVHPNQVRQWRLVDKQTGECKSLRYRPWRSKEPSTNKPVRPFYCRSLTGLFCLWYHKKIPRNA